MSCSSACKIPDLKELFIPGHIIVAGVYHVTFWCLSICMSILCFQSITGYLFIVQPSQTVFVCVFVWGVGGGWVGGQVYTVFTLSVHPLHSDKHCSWAVSF